VAIRSSCAGCQEQSTPFVNGSACQDHKVLAVLSPWQGQNTDVTVLDRGCPQPDITEALTRVGDSGLKCYENTDGYTVSPVQHGHRQVCDAAYEHLGCVTAPKKLKNICSVGTRR
jgi:hypothetical protein